MLKRDELTKGCMAKAHPEEMTFVLLGRDPAAAMTIECWIAERLRLGLNQPTDPKIVEAAKVVDVMRAQAMQYALDLQRDAMNRQRDALDRRWMKPAGVNQKPPGLRPVPPSAPPHPRRE